MADDRYYTLPPGFRDIPERVNLTTEVLRRAQARRDHIALTGDFGSMTYGELTRGVQNVAAALRDKGLGKGMRVLLRMQNRPEFAIAFLALCRIGAVPVLQNSLATAVEIKEVLENCEPVAAIVAADLAAPLHDRPFEHGIVMVGEEPLSASEFERMRQTDAKPDSPTETRADDLAFMVFTSGTSGKPKGIMHAHRWTIALGDSNSLRVPPRENDVVLSSGEWSFVAALGQNLLFPLRNGVTVCVLSGRAVPDNVLRTVERFHVTLLYSVATVYRRILAEDGIENRYDLGSLRGCNSTGEALETATYEEWVKRFKCPIWEHYGISEMQMVFGQGPQVPARPGSVGPALPGTTVAVLDDDYRPVPSGTVGNLLVAADNPGFFLGYSKNPDLTAQVMRNGWYHTGDLAWQDDVGYIWIAGRSDDCFKSRGIFISPVEIENALREHGAVSEACVVQRPDPEIGNQIRAVVVLKAHCEPGQRLADDIRRSLAARLARYKIPHTIEFVPSLPKSAVGKVLRRVLREAS